MVLATGTEELHNIIQLTLCIGFHELGLLHKIFTSPSILDSGLCMLYHIFIIHYSHYLPLTKPDLRYL
jgi:hypothetical protein